jgi:hypothetical protein
VGVKKMKKGTKEIPAAILFLGVALCIFVVSTLGFFYGLPTFAEEYTKNPDGTTTVRTIWAPAGSSAQTIMSSTMIACVIFTIAAIVYFSYN